MFDPTAVQAAPAPPHGPNLIALLAGIWFRPGRTSRAVAAGPAWLPIFAIAFATVIGLVSGVYPALRAATLDPLRALKYE